MLTDDAAYVAEPSVRVRDRQLARRLERLGWTVAQVWSAAAFLDPQGEADAITRTVLAHVAARALLKPPPAATVPPEGLPDDEAEPALADPALPARPRPQVEPGLVISAYSDDQLDDLAAWIVSDGVPRDPHALGGALRAELGIARRGARVDAAISRAVLKILP